jgi:hypothetical protein
MVRQQSIKRYLSGLGAAALLLGLAAQALLPSLAFAANCLGTAQANACQITNRSLLLEPGATSGGSLPGNVATGTVNHKFSFTLNDTNDNLAAIAFQYCTTAAAVPNGTGCVAPVGINTSAVTLGTNTGATGWTATTHETGWDDAADTVNNGVLLTRPAANLGGGASGVPVVVELDNIMNPSATNTTFYVRIWTFQSSTVTLSSLTASNADDAGTVAASTANPIVLTGTMPESLIFCTGATINISTVTTLPDCSTATSGNISFNQLFDPNTTSWATSQMAASTNAGQGYQITLAGKTMMSGSNKVAAIGSTAAVSIPGTAQFGLNLIDDKNPTAPIVTDPTIGTGSANPITYWNGDSAGTGGAINPVSNASNGFYALPNTGFNGAGGASNHPTYSFNDTGVNTVAESNFGGTLSPTNSQRYTATYIVNVPGNQPAGSYTTTLTYICTATY